MTRLPDNLNMEDLLNYLLKPLVTDLEKVKIEKIQDGSRVMYLISVPKEDIAKVIGKNGKMIKSIKNLVKIRSIKQNVFANLEVQEI